ncbi:MAG: hypothetical protein ACXVAG_17150 [Vulcanimicrobiaceae bacterium]
MTTTNRPLRKRESSVGDGWLSFVFGRDDDRRRTIISFALSFALIEIFAGLIPANWRMRPIEDREVVTHVEIARLEHRPVPTPVPTPKPTPKPVVRTHVIAPAHIVTKVINPAPTSENQHIRRKAQKRPIARTIYHLAPAHIHVPTGGQGASTSQGIARTGGIGTGGSGTGAGGNGNGTGGAPASNEPCGFVEFIPTGENQYDRATGGFFENIRMTVHFPDHSLQSVDLDYPWYYVSDAADPWSEQNLKNPNFPVTFQSPPPNKAGQEPDLVQYVMRHSSADGYTKLKDCPGEQPTGQ